MIRIFTIMLYQGNHFTYLKIKINPKNKISHKMIYLKNNNQT